MLITLRTARLRLRLLPPGCPRLFDTEFVFERTYRPARRSFSSRAARRPTRVGGGASARRPRLRSRPRPLKELGTDLGSLLDDSGAQSSTRGRWTGPSV